MKKPLTTFDTQYRVIKKVIEESSGIVDLSIKSRKRYIVDCRFVYFHLCKKYIPKFILADCGSEVGKDHSMVIHGLIEFENMFNQPTFKAYDVYLKAIEILEDDFYFSNNVASAVKRLEELTNKIKVEYELISA